MALRTVPGQFSLLTINCYLFLYLVVNLPSKEQCSNHDFRGSLREARSTEDGAKEDFPFLFRTGSFLPIRCLSLNTSRIWSVRGTPKH